VIYIEWTCNENVDIKLVHTARFWNNFHQVRSTAKGWKTK